MVIDLYLGFDFGFDFDLGCDSLVICSPRDPYLGTVLSLCLLGMRNAPSGSCHNLQHLLVDP